MITKEIVAQTVELLEDLIDTKAARIQFLSNADRPAADKYVAEAQSLLNFWRLYLEFVPDDK